MDKHPRILFIDQAKDVGGAELSLISIAKSLPESEILAFVEGTFTDALEKNGINHECLNLDAEILSLSKEKANLIRIVLSFSKLIFSMLKISSVIKNFDVIVFNTQKSLILGAIAAKFQRKKTIFFLHDILSIDHFNKFNLLLINIFTANFCDVIIANSRATARAVEKLNPKKKLKIKVIHIGISQKIELKNDNKIFTKKSLGLSKNKIVGSFSRIARWKGQHILIESLEHLPKYIHCLIVGSPFFGEEAYYGYLQQIASRPILKDRVHFIPFKTDPLSLMRLCDIVTHNSTAPEPFGRIIVEGMLCKKPVIATNMGGAKEIIRNNKSGYLIEPGDPQLLARTILAIFSNKDEARSITKEAYETAVRNFSEDKMTARIKKIINNI